MKLIYMPQMYKDTKDTARNMAKVHVHVETETYRIAKQAALDSGETVKNIINESLKHYLSGVGYVWEVK